MPWRVQPTSPIVMGRVSRTEGLSPGDQRPAAVIRDQCPQVLPGGCIGPPSGRLSIGGAQRTGCTDIATDRCRGRGSRVNHVDQPGRLRVGALTCG